MIPNKGKEGWHYLAVKKLYILWRGVTSKHCGDFCCLNCLHTFTTENKLKSHEKVCKNKDFCGIVMPTENNKISKFNQYLKSDRMPHIIYADLECLIKKIDGCENNPENSSTTKIGQHIPCGYSMSTILGFGHIENKHNLFSRKDYMKKFCDSLKELAKNIIGFEKKKMLPLTKKELKSQEDAK